MNPDNKKNIAKRIISIFIFLVFGLFFILSSSQEVTSTHWIYGYVADAYEGEGADGHIVRVFCNTSDRTNNVNDTIGVTGNSGTANYWMVDVDGYCNWQVGDVMYADVFNSGDDYVSNTTVNVTTTATTDAMPNMRINSIPVIESAYATDEVTPGNDINFAINYSDDDNESVAYFVCKDSSCSNCNASTQTNCWCYSTTLSNETLQCNYTTSSSNSHANNYWVSVFDSKVYSSVSAGNDTSFLVNHAPTITGVNLPSVSSVNYDLSCNYSSVSDNDGDSTYITYNWFENGTSLTTLLMPFDTRMPRDSIVYDFSGNEKDGTVVGNATWTSDGKIGGAYKFLSASNDYISVGNLSMGTNWTITFYLNQTNNPTAISYPIGIANPYSGIFTQYATQSDKWGVYDSSSVILANSVVNLNEESFLAVVKSGTNYIFYKNGVNDGNGTGSSTLTFDDLLIGKRSNGYGITGTIDEVYIFNRSLTSNEISSIYSNGLKKLVSEELKEGTNYSCSAVALDEHGYNGTIQTSNETYINYKPTVNSVYVTPFNAFTFDFLRCYINISDKDNSTNLKTNITWYKNGIKWNSNNEQITGISTNDLYWSSWSGTIKRVYTSKNDTWICSANPYDEISYGGWVNST